MEFGLLPIKWGQNECILLKTYRVVAVCAKWYQQTPDRKIKEKFRVNYSKWMSVHTDTPCTHCTAHTQATNIFFENASLFEWHYEHTPHCCCNRTWRIKFCWFLHKQKGNIVRNTVPLISALKIMFAPCSHQPWFVECLQKINILHSKDMLHASGTVHAQCGHVYQP